MEKEREIQYIDIKCKSCGNINKEDLGDFLLAMRSNHFYRCTCNSCKVKSLVIYKHEVIPMKSDELPQDAIKNLVIQ